MQITSSANPRVKALVRLQQRASERRATGRFCVETPRALARALAAGLVLRELWLGPDHGLERLPPAHHHTVPASVLAKIAYRQHPSGFVAVFEAPARTLADLPAPAAPLYVVCSGLEKPGNLGAILRSADGAGADAVLLDRDAVDLFSPQTIRASTGAVFTLPVAGAPADALVPWLRGRGVQIVAATPDADRRYTDVDLTGPTALVMGAEAEGLDGGWRGAADARVRIPMAGVADSLNVSVAAALLVYEARRQRG